MAYYIDRVIHVCDGEKDNPHSIVGGQKQIQGRTVWRVSLEEIDWGEVRSDTLLRMGWKLCPWCGEKLLRSQKDIASNILFLTTEE